MASVTNLKLRDGVGTVVPVEAFFSKDEWMASFKRRINSWIQNLEILTCYIVTCDKSTDLFGDLFALVCRVSVGLPGLSCEDEWFPQW